MLTESITRKKNAYQSKIRKDWLNEYFLNQRKQFHKVSNQTCIQNIQLINQLPNTLTKLAQKSQHQPSMGYAIVQHYHVLKQHIAVDKITSYNWYMYNQICQVALTEMSSKFPSYSQQSIEIFNIMVNHGLRLIEQQKVQSKNILDALVKLIICLNRHLINLTVLDVCTLGDIIRMYILLVNMNNVDELSHSVLILNIFLALSYDDDKQNTNQILTHTLLNNKYVLIQNAFFQNHKVINKLIEALFVADNILLEELIRLLITVTYIIKGPLYYTILSQYHIFVAILHLLNNYQDEYVLKLTIRLSYNLIAEDINLLHKASQSLIINKLMQLVTSNISKQIKLQIYETFSELIPAYLGDQYFIQCINKLKLPQLLFNWLQDLQMENHYQTCQIISEALLSLIIYNRTMVYHTFNHYKNLIYKMTDMKNNIIRQNALMMLQKLQEQKIINQ